MGVGPLVFVLWDGTGDGGIGVVEATTCWRNCSHRSLEGARRGGGPTSSVDGSLDNEPEDLNTCANRGENALLVTDGEDAEELGGRLRSSGLVA